MRNILLIAKREYLEQIRGRAFRISTVLVPLIFIAAVGVGILANRLSGVGKHVMIAAPDVQLAADMQSQILEDKDAKTTVDIVAPVSAAERASLIDKVRGKEIDGLLWIEGSPSSKITATFTSQSAGDIVIASRLESALNHALSVERLTERGMSLSDVALVTKNVSVETHQVDKEGREVESNAAGSFGKGYIMALLLMMTSLLYGMNVARSIIQEKTSRIFEVMLASVKASDLLAGKLIGTGAVGITQLAIWGVAGAAIAAYPAAAAVLSGKLSIHISWIEAVIFLVYFILGYLLNSSIFAGLAATCETEQELQMYTPLVSVPVALSFSFIIFILNNPNSIWSIAASLFPLTAPIIMMLRMGAQMPPAWQFVASIGLLALSVWVILWVSAKLYRVGILMYGKRATLPEMLRWLRYS